MEEIIKKGEDLYKLVRVFREDQFPDEIDVDLIKEEFFIDTVLKRQGKLFLCRKIEDAIIINEKIEENEETIQEETN
jgi:uncharacterized protein (DUF2164 family)